MAKQDINTGASANDGTGDPARTAFTKTNANFNEVYTALGAPLSGAIPAALPVDKGGTGAATAAAARTSLGLGTAATRDVTTSPIDTTPNNLLKVGDFGLGSMQLRVVDTDSPDKVTGFWAVAPRNPSPLPEFGSSIRVQRTANVFSELFLPYSTGARALAVGVRSNYQGNQVDQTIYSSQNPIVHSTNNAATSGRLVTVESSGEFRSKGFTVDSNGFIKNASPIVQLFANKIELNDEAKQQDIEFEKLGAGDYLIKNTSGFAQEGWYIEQPKDANGNVLVAVVYEQLENNDISVKTYKKKFDLEIASIVADLDKPVDIPDGRWIDIRLQELPQPEPTKIAEDDDVSE